MANKSTSNQVEQLEQAVGQILVKFLVGTSTGKVCLGQLLKPAVEPFADYVRKHLGLS